LLFLSIENKSYWILLISNRQLPTHTLEIKKRPCKVEITAGQETAKTTFKKETPKRRVFIAVLVAATAAITLRRIIDVFVDSNNYNLALSNVTPYNVRHKFRGPSLSSTLSAFFFCSSFFHRSASVKSPCLTYRKRERVQAGKGPVSLFCNS